MPPNDQRGGVVGAKGDRGMPMTNGGKAIFLAPAGAQIQDFVTERDLTVSDRVVGIDRKCAFQQRDSLQRTVGHSGIGQRRRAQHQIVGVEAFGTLALGPFDFGLAQARFDRSDRTGGDFVLQGKNVVHRPIVTLGPEMGAIIRFDQLRRDPHPARGFAHAAFEHVTHAEFAADLLDVDRLALVDEGRVAGDDEQPFEPRQTGGDVLDQPVGEILLLRIAAHVLERQHGDRGFFRKLQRHGRTAFLHPQAKDTHRLRDVFELLLAHVARRRWRSCP